MHRWKAGVTAKTNQGLYIYKPRIKKNKKTKHQFINTIQENKEIEIEKVQQEPPGCKLADVNYQENNNSFARVNENIPIVEKKIKNK